MNDRNSNNESKIVYGDSVGGDSYKDVTGSTITVNKHTDKPKEKNNRIFSGLIGSLLVGISASLLATLIYQFI